MSHPHSGGRGADPAPASIPALELELDLALRLENLEGDPLPAALAPLLGRAGRLADADADGHWQTLLRGWLASLQAELPAAWRRPAYSLGLLLTDDATIAALNGQWRQSPEATDVLAFAALDGDADGDGDAPAGARTAEPLELGDIVISLETAARQAGEGEGAMERELLFLASHGLLHLLGWDHPDDNSLAAMLERQEQLIRAAS